MKVRPATHDDAAAIQAIYAPVVQSTFISFETEPPSVDEVRARIAAKRARYPWLVTVEAADDGEQVTGYAYASQHRDRAAYRWSVDVSVYVGAAHRGRGIGTTLYRALIAKLREQGFVSAYAGIELPNAASVRLHRPFAGHLAAWSSLEVRAFTPQSGSTHERRALHWKIERSLNIKAQGLLNAAAWIEHTHGQAALRDVLRGCSQSIRDRYTSAIAINWHPMSELVEFLTVADRVVGRGDGKLAEEVGAAGARANMKGTFTRLIFYLFRRDLLITRIAQMWSRYNDEGSMELIAIEDRQLVVEVRGVPAPSAIFCATITGWTREVVTAAGAENSTSAHVECRARGGRRCIWRARWSNSAHEIANRETEQASRRIAAPRESSPSLPPAPPSRPPASRVPKT